MLTDLNLCAVADEFGGCAALGDVVQKRIDKLFIGLDRIHICSVGTRAEVTPQLIAGVSE